MDNTCLDCGEKLKGRVDKKFCSSLCRNSFYNKQNKDATNFMRNVNNTLRKNRTVLKQLIPEGDTKIKINKQKLMFLGFNFNYYTSTYTTKLGQIYFFCYEYGYLPLEKEMYVLVKNSEYNKKG